MSKMTPAMTVAYNAFLKAFDDGDAYMEANPATDGWTLSERNQNRAIHARDIHHKTFGALARLELIKHVGDGFWTINFR